MFIRISKFQDFHTVATFPRAALSH